MDAVSHVSDRRPISQHRIGHLIGRLGQLPVGVPDGVEPAVVLRRRNEGMDERAPTVRFAMTRQYNPVAGFSDGFEVSHHLVGGRVLRAYSVPNNLFRRRDGFIVCVNARYRRVDSDG